MSYAANPRVPKPSADEIPQEPTGPIASDSLAAESIQSSGGFADNENADIMGVKGASSTLANTDTSGASVLRPADDAEERDAGDAMALGRDERGTAGGVKYPDGMDKAEFPGAHNADGYVGGPSSGTNATTGNNTQDYGGATIGPGSSSVDPPTSTSTSTSDGATGPTDPGSAGVRPYVDSAPNAFADIRSEGQMKPKGENLIEGDMPQTKTFTGDVGGPHDPGRLAEQQMLGENASAPGEGVGGVRQGKQELGGSSGGFDVLGSERAGNQGGIDE